jgi:hypothetical protein
VREDRLHQTGFDELVRILLKLGRLAACAQRSDCGIGFMFRLTAVIAATAADVQSLVGVVRIEVAAHGISL